MLVTNRAIPGVKTLLAAMLAGVLCLASDATTTLTIGDAVTVPGGNAHLPVTMVSDDQPVVIAGEIHFDTGKAAVLDVKPGAALIAAGKTFAWNDPEPGVIAFVAFAVTNSNIIGNGEVISIDFWADDGLFVSEIIPIDGDSGSVSDATPNDYPITFVDGEIEIVNCFEPAAPTGVDASNGIWPNLVRVIWNASNGATSYRVYRSSDNNPNNAEFIGETDGVYFDDFNAGAVNTGGCSRMAGDPTSYFWVEAWSPCGNSEWSVPDAGSVSGSKAVQIGGGIEPAPASVIPVESLGEFVLFALLVLALLRTGTRVAHR